jgi:hypothetical protein
VADKYVIQVKSSTGWAVFTVVIIVIGVIFLANRPTSAAGNGASVAISLKVVPTVRSVTVSPGTASFGHCTGGNPGADTASTSTELGYPNGHCWDGAPGASGRFPITITYKGPPGQVYITGSNAVPSAGTGQWSLCNPAAACKGPGGLPGPNQYLVENFGMGSSNSTGLTGSPTCDQQFGPGGCTATAGKSQKEGFELIGPESSDNTAQLWTVTIRWAALPLGP